MMLFSQQLWYGRQNFDVRFCDDLAQTGNQAANGESKHQSVQREKPVYSTHATNHEYEGEKGERL